MHKNQRLKGAMKITVFSRIMIHTGVVNVSHSTHSPVMFSALLSVFILVFLDSYRFSFPKWCFNRTHTAVP